MEKLWLPKNNNRLIAVFAVLLACFFSVFAQEARTSSLLERPVGAQALAMSGAATAMSGNFCAFINPAQLALIRTRQVAFGTGLATMGRAEGFVSGEFAISPRVGMSLNLLYRGDPFLTDLHDENEEQLFGGGFTTITIKTALSCRFTRNFSAGASIGVYYQELPTSYSTSGALFYSSSMTIGGIDLGMLYEINPAHTVGLTLRELNNTTNWNIPYFSDFSDPTPEAIDPILTLGYSGNYLFLKRPLTVAADLAAFVFTNTFAVRTYKRAVVSVGAGWRYNEILTLRAGCGQLPLTGELIDDFETYTDYATITLAAGCGLNLDRFIRGVHCNYALASDKQWAGIDQQIDFSLKF